VRDCLGDSDSMACYMAAAGVAFVLMGSLEGPSNNVARRAARAADVADDVGDAARRVDDVAETQVRNGSAWQPAEVPTDPIEQTDYLYQGDYLERELGIYFTADGRYYDPWLGKYLQPDPLGGPPLIPQAADRYQVAGNSPTGVGWIGTARNGEGIDLLSPPAWASVAADIGLKVAEHHLLLKPGVLILRGSAPELFGAIAFQNFPGRYALLRNAPRRLVANLGVYDVTVRGDIIDDLGGGMFGFRRARTTLDASGLGVVTYERGLLLGESKLASALASMGLTLLVDVGFEGFGALTGTGRWGNPYWTIQQKRAQTFLVELW
jgi:RHS repeat-associated protein